MFHEDINAGLIGILDCSNGGIEWLSKFSMTHFKVALEVSLGILPSRVRALHVINMPPFAEALYLLLKSLLPEKIRKRVRPMLCF